MLNVKPKYCARPEKPHTNKATTNLRHEVCKLLKVLHILIFIFVPQCFVTDRKVDEEIGTNKCFQADPDDLLRQIMGFGKGQLVNYNRPNKL